MDYLDFLTLSVCFLIIFPRSSLQLRDLPDDIKLNDPLIRLKRSGAGSAGFDPTRVTQLSWKPRAFHYKGLLTDEECDHLIELAKDKLEKSMVADNESGKSVMSEVRISSGMFLDKAQDEVVAAVENRIASWTFLPVGSPGKIKGEPWGPWTFARLLPLFDPPRHDSAETIHRALNLGVCVKMITGDQLAIAKETIGMGTDMYL